MLRNFWNSASQGCAREISIPVAAGSRSPDHFLLQLSLEATWVNCLSGQHEPLFGLVLASELGGYLSPRFGRVNSEAISLHQLSPPSHIWLSKSKTKTPGQGVCPLIPGSGHQNETGRKGPGDSGATAESERSRNGSWIWETWRLAGPGDHLV